jgi:outer membrane protein OmpA-like peptidoglycan-associated protein
MRRLHLHGLTVAMVAVGMMAGLGSLPAAAQSGDTTAAPQTATQSQTQAQAPATPAPEMATKKAPLEPQIRQGFWGHLNPFARKKYVEGQLSPIRDRVNEVDGLTADNAKSIADLDARSKAGISAAQQKAQQANDTADAAQQQVQQASDHATQLDQQVSGVNTKLQGVDQYQVAQQAELHFKPGPATLTTDTQQQLDSFLQNLNTEKGYVVEVTAYSSRKGAAGITASQQLADTVVRYLVLQHNVPLYRIYTAGMGNAAPAAAQMSSTPGARSTAGGTVEIKVLKNSLAAGSQP